MEPIIAIDQPGSTITQDTITLDYDRRCRRRLALRTANGRDILLNEARPVHLVNGAILRLADGSAVQVIAEAEALLEITANSSSELVRIAWHLGNRHLPTQLLPGANGGTIHIREDHVIAAMVEGLGGRVVKLVAAFDPESGAYAEGTGGHHHHAHDHDHGHDHHHHEHAHG